MYYAPTSGQEDWRNEPHGGTRRRPAISLTSTSRLPPPLTHPGPALDARFRAAATATGAALHFVAADLEQRPWRELAAAGEAWRTWRLFRPWCFSAHGITDPPMPSTTSLGPRYVWPFLIWLFKVDQNLLIDYLTVFWMRGAI